MSDLPVMNEFSLNLSSWSCDKKPHMSRLFFFFFLVVA